MKAVSLFLLTAATTVLSAQDGTVKERDFTNLSGKTIHASVVRVQGTNVHLKVGSEIYPVPISTLVEEDKTYLKSWLQENPSYALRFAVYQREGESPLGGELEPEKNPVDEQLARMRNFGRDPLNGDSNSGKPIPEKPCHYEVIIINDSGVELKDVEVQCRVFVKRSRRGEDNGIGVEQIGGTTRVPVLRVGPGNKVKTPTISVSGKRSLSVTSSTYTVAIPGTFNSRTYSVSDVTRETENPEAAGIWIRVYHKGRFIEGYQDLHDEVSRRNPVWSESATMMKEVTMP